jgi:hypothetical protein
MNSDRMCLKRVNAFFIAKNKKATRIFQEKAGLTAGVTDLDTSLTDVKGNYFSHSEFLSEKIKSRFS